MCDAKDEDSDFDIVRDYLLIDPYDLLEPPTDKFGKQLREESRRRDAVLIPRLIAQVEAKRAAS